MNYQSNRFEICLATEKDDPELLLLLEEVEMPGDIRIIYTRRPSPIQSFNHEGNLVSILICRDLKEKCIVCLGAFAIRTIYLNGQESKVAYLFGLRSLKRYKLRFPIKSGYEFLKNQLPHSVDFIYTSILENNFGAINLFTKNHLAMPKYQKLFTYTTLCLNQRKIIKSAPKKNIIRQASIDDAERVYQYFQSNCRKINGFPALEKSDLLDINSDVYIGQFFISFNQNHAINGLMRVLNSNNYKQYIITGYSWKMKVYQAIRTILPFNRFPLFPKIGQHFDISFIANWVLEHYNEDLLIDFLAFICNQKVKIPFLIFGLPMENPYFKIISRLSYINIRSGIYQVSWEDRKVQTQFKPPFYLECSAL